MKTTITLISFLLFFFLNDLSATTYTTIANGDYDNNTTWSGGIIPPTILPSGDEVVINHAVTLSKDIIIRGLMTINNGASLTGNQKLDVGRGAATGELINDGTIDVNELKVQGNNSSGNPNIPIFTNNDVVRADTMMVGNNDGFGKVINNASGTITINRGVQIANFLSNAGNMAIGGKLQIHGGTLSGGGAITICVVHFGKNGTRPGKIIDQNICCNFGTLDEPDYKVKDDNATYQTLDDLVGAKGLNSMHHDIDPVDFYSCGMNSLGQLPVELVSLWAEENERHHAVISWATESEDNNDFFIIERSADGRDFDALGVIEGSGSSTVFQSYTFIDNLPLSFAYYRLKQVDYDGNFEFSDVITLEMKSFKPYIIETFPTVTEQELTLRFTTFDSRKSFLKVVSSYGKLMMDEEIYTTEEMGYRNLDVSAYESGIYYVMLSDGHQTRTSKFVVLKTY